MALITGADIKFLSDKWRGTAILVILTICISVLSVVSFWILKEFEIILATIAVLLLLNREAIKFDLKEITKIIDSLRNLMKKKEEKRD